VAAIAVSLGLALVSAALMARSVAALRGARAEFERVQAEYQLAGDQQRAALALITDASAGSVRAEPEAGKIDLATAAALDTEVLSRFGVANPGRLSSWLRAASLEPTSPADLVNADRARLWKLCAPMLISAFGRASSLSAPVEVRATGAGARLGEVWRFSARTSNGWTDERIVRFTGEPRRPAAVIWRRFYRAGTGGESCAEIFAQPTRG
jgi:hypothetical protein